MRIGVIAKSSWKDLPNRVRSLAKSISAKLPVKVEIDLRLTDYGDIPADRNGRILPSWFKKVAKLPGYDGACVLVSIPDRKRYNLKPTLRGHYIRDEDGFIDFWVASDRLTKRNGKPQFEETFSHELLHGLYHWVGIPPTDDETKHRPGRDNTHYFHNVVGSLDGAFAEVRAAWPKPKPKSAVPVVSGGMGDKLDGVDPRLADIARRTIGAMRELGKPVFVYEGFRSLERQAELYAQGRTKPGKIVTNAKPGESKHNQGKAVDIVFEKTLWSNPEADWKLLGMMFKSLALAKGVKVSHGGDWAGFKDWPHFEIA